MDTSRESAAGGHGRWVLWNPERRMYVRPPGEERSFTRSPTRAAIYPSKSAADANRCGDEVAIPREEC